MSTSTVQRAEQLVELLAANGVPATLDPADAMPPVVLVTPPRREYDLPVGFTVEWRLAALAAPPGGLAAWEALDDLADRVAELLDVERVELAAYQLTPDGPSCPAYLLTMREAIGDATY